MPQSHVSFGQELGNLFVSVLAGTPARSGDNDGPPAGASFMSPHRVCVLSDGGVILSDKHACKIRLIRPQGNGVVTLFVNSGPRLSLPTGIALCSGGVLVCDTGHNRILLCSPESGRFLHFAGSSISGLADGPSHTARFSTPCGVCVLDNGVVVVADTGNNAIRVIDDSHFVTTLCGGPGAGFVDCAVPEKVRFSSPSAVASFHGQIAVADTGNNAIRLVAPNGTTTTLAGTGTPGHVDGPLGEAQFSAPADVCSLGDDRLLVADRGNSAIRLITDQRVTTLAGGTGAGFRDGAAVDAQFSFPQGIACDMNGNIYVADTNNYVMRVITASVAPLERSTVELRSSGPVSLLSPQSDMTTAELVEASHFIGFQAKYNPLASQSDARSHSTAGLKMPPRPATKKQRRILSGSTISLGDLLPTNAQEAAEPCDISSTSTEVLNVADLSGEDSPSPLQSESVREVSVNTDILTAICGCLTTIPATTMVDLVLVASRDGTEPSEAALKCRASLLSGVTWPIVDIGSRQALFTLLAMSLHTTEALLTLQIEAHDDVGGLLTYAGGVTRGFIADGYADSVLVFNGRLVMPCQAAPDAIECSVSGGSESARNCISLARSPPVALWPGMYQIPFSISVSPIRRVPRELQLCVEAAGARVECSTRFVSGIEGPAASDFLGRVLRVTQIEVLGITRG